MKLLPASSEVVVNAIEADLRFSFTRESTLLAAACEQLRAIVALEAKDPSNENRYPSPTIRLTQSLVSRLHSLWPALNNADTSTALSELEHLNAITDLVKVNGKWYLGPARLVAIDETCCLLLGGGPLHLLPSILRNEAEVIGRARILIVSQRTQGPIAKWPFQKLEDWLGTTGSDISNWAAEFQKSRIREAIAEDESELGDATVFDSLRWIPFSQYRGGRKVILFRRTVSYYGTKTFAYGLAKVVPDDSNPPKILATIAIEKDDARRLQGAMQVGGNRRRLEYTNRGKLILLRVPYPLPKPENRFLSLGWPAHGSEVPKQWPKEFYFSKRLVPLIAKALDCLGYELIERNERERHGTR